MILFDEQLCVMDIEWMGLLDCLHSGACTSDDIALLEMVTLDTPACMATDLNEHPWNNAIFITS